MVLTKTHGIESVILITHIEEGRVLPVCRIFMKKIIIRLKYLNMLLSVNLKPLCPGGPSEGGGGGLFLFGHPSKTNYYSFKMMN